MEITIRDARAEDVDAVHEILVSESVIAGSMRYAGQSIRITEERLAPKDDRIRLVATVEDQAVGFAEIVMYSGEPRYRHVATLNMIAVQEDLQGAGVGQALMDKILDLADNWLQIRRLDLYVFETNDRAYRWYKRLGFEHEGTLSDFVFIDGKHENAIIMARFRP